MKKLTEEITFETTAYHYPDEGVVSVNVRIKMNVVGNQIFYHVIWMGFEKRNFICGILILKNKGLFSTDYNYTFRHEQKDYYLNIEI